MTETSTFIMWTILTLANIFDARSYRIPNQLVVLGYAAGFCLNITADPINGVFSFLIKAVWPVIILFLLYILKGLGAGDIKLFSVMSTVVGTHLTAEAMIASVMLAGVAVLGLLIYERRLDLKRRLHFSFYITAAFLSLQFIN